MVMSDVVRVEPVDEVYVRVTAEPSIAQEIADAFTYEVPGARFTPRFQAGLWDGKIALFSIYRPVFYKGLVTELYKFCVKNGYRLSVAPGVAPKSHEVEKSWASEITADVFEDREYQLNAFTEALQMDRGVFLSSTSSGKTLMIYRLMLFYSEELEKPSLMLTTRTNLVAQAALDFAKYSAGKVEVRVGKVVEGSIRDAVADSNDLVVCTWQSALRAEKKWFAKFGAIIADEAHSWDSGAFVKIAERANTVKYRFGFTGTLDGSKVNRMVLTGLFGPVITVSTNKERVDAGDVAKPRITCIRLIYPSEEKKLAAKFGTNEQGKRVPMRYGQEIEHIIASKARRDVVVELCASLKGNTLVLFNRNEKYGIPLFEELKRKAADRECRLVYGATDVEDRIAVQRLMEEKDNVIAQASLGTFSEGMSVDNIRNVIFTWPMKGQVRLLQSIGRGLRKMVGKETCRFYDIVDDLRWKRRDNHLWKHAMIRCQIYDAEGFEYSWREIEI